MLFRNHDFFNCFFFFNRLRDRRGGEYETSHYRIENFTISVELINGAAALNGEQYIFMADNKDSLDNFSAPG
ncbi:MAG: hypothetical protein CVV44_03055 [Spirochaetae bacterium HGW-Spirochaetae-1]|nr:MAG: hypothetical protein CVV44_03055 [Spirochaetae bacterium HGW-Spirochaetae-1]